MCARRAAPMPASTLPLAVMDVEDMRSQPAPVGMIAFLEKTSTATVESRIFSGDRKFFRLNCCLHMGEPTRTPLLIQFPEYPGSLNIRKLNVRLCRDEA